MERKRKIYRPGRHEAEEKWEWSLVWRWRWLTVRQRTSTRQCVSCLVKLKTYEPNRRLTQWMNEWMSEETRQVCINLALCHLVQELTSRSQPGKGKLACASCQSRIRTYPYTTYYFWPSTLTLTQHIRKQASERASEHLFRPRHAWMASKQFQSNDRTCSLSSLLFSSKLRQRANDSRHHHHHHPSPTTCWSLLLPSSCSLSLWRVNLVLFRSTARTFQRQGLTLSLFLSFFVRRWGKWGRSCKTAQYTFIRVSRLCRLFSPFLSVSPHSFFLSFFLYRHRTELNHTEPTGWYLSLSLSVLLVVPSHIVIPELLIWNSVVSV